MSSLVWLDAPPHVEGWYWTRHWVKSRHLKSHWSSPMITYAGGDIPCVPAHLCGDKRQWAGPIDQPKEAS